jgi:uncharacterized protein YuzE
LNRICRSQAGYSLVWYLARIFHEFLSRDHADGRACPPSRACSLRRGGRATWQPRGVGFEAYLDGTSQGELVLSVAEGTPEDARKDGHIQGSQQAIHETFGLTIGEEDKIIGIEILDASKHVNLDRLLPVNYEVSKNAI